ncbi:serine protease FAM111B-like [Rhincodon typus]|uniref:serine protease FAM111B-like n=1 Tax=Rhincodon typus TaxID=259920 RepID=UPI00202EEC1D|nr:serine protease FAM111B-like [Rhincodon typus]XP_048476835.1 serine protease FAM111B-like [Rhincodon typus]
MPRTPHRKSKTLLPLGKESIRPFLKGNDENPPTTAVLDKRPHPERRRPLTEWNRSTSTGKVPAVAPGKVTVNSDEDRVKEFTFNLQSNGIEHVAKGKPNESVYSVLMSSVVFKKEQEKSEGKTFHLIGKRGLMGAINLGMPCKCLPEKTHFEVIFYRVKGEVCYRDEDSSGKQCVVFHVKSTGKTGGDLHTGSKLITNCGSLRKDGHDMCVYAFEGETIREALCKDGRFLPIIKQNVWSLVEGHRCLQFTLTVNDLRDKCFEVQVSNEKYKAGNKNDDNNDNASPRERQEQDSVPGERNMLHCELRKQVDERLGKKKGKKHFCKEWNLLKKEFGKIAADGVPITVHEMLVRLSESVGFVQWDNNGNQGTASCFYLGNSYILTCFHVVKMMVGDGVPDNEWKTIIEKAMTINFSYKEKQQPVNGWYNIEPWFEVSNSELDYAVLRLKIPNGQPSVLPSGLWQTKNCPPWNGMVYIIGHPDGVCKSSDTCFVIPIQQRNIQYYMQVFRRYTFTEIQSSDRITYNSCFFNGASGSPVFNSSGELVGMHAAGYEYKTGNQRNSVIEYGPTIKAITDHMKIHHPGFDFTGQVHTQDDQNILFDDQGEVPMDIE